MIVERVTDKEHVSDLLPNEVLVRIGCKGCIGAGCGEFIASRTTKLERAALVEDLTVAQELSGLPMRIANNVGVASYEGEQVCSGNPVDCPGDSSGLLTEILTETI